MMRIRVGPAVVVALLLSSGSAGAAWAAATPLAGDWEGSGPHGLPLSFRLEHQAGHLRATSLAVGYPASCPAVKRNAEAVPFLRPVYAGPGSGPATGAAVASLSGRLPRSGQQVVLSGAFTSAHSGAFSVHIAKKLGCGWPAKTLTWTVHRARRQTVRDGTWTGPLTASGLINGNVRLVVGAQGRVVDSFTSFFTCLTDTEQGNTTFRSVPAFAFVRPGGSFFSQLDGGRVKGHRTRWAGRFSTSGRLSGAITIFDDCTNQLIRAQFSATRTRPG